MALFFFDLVGPRGGRRDRLGLDCDTLEAAYLELLEAMRIDAAELFDRRENPFTFRYRISDAARRLLMEVPFDELLRGRDANARREALSCHAARTGRLDRNHALRLRAVEVRARADAARMHARSVFERCRVEASQVRRRIEAAAL